MVIKLALIEGVDNTVISPIINQIVKDMNDKIIKDSTAFIYKKTMYDDENIDIQDNVFDNAIGGSNIDVDYELNDNEELSTALSVYKPISQPIFQDDDIGLIIRPQYMSTDINITLKYRGQSKTILNNILNRLKTLFNNTGYILTHDLQYSFIIPTNIMSLVTNIASLKDDSMPVEDYIRSIAKYNYDLITTRDKRYKAPSFRACQSGIYGNFINIPNEVKVNKESVSEYSIEIQYVITIHKPIAISIKYPILVNNKMLDEIWIPKRSVGRFVERDNSKLSVMNILDTVINNPANNIDRLFKFPTYDTWVPDGLYEDNMKIRFMSVLIQRDNTNTTLLCNLNDFKTLGLDNTILDYMKNKGNDIFIFGKSIFYLEFYEVDYIRDLDLYIDNENIYARTELLINKTYHIVLSIITDMNYMQTVTDEDIAILESLNVNYKVKKVNSVINVKQ